MKRNINPKTALIVNVISVIVALIAVAFAIYNYQHQQLLPNTPPATHKVLKTKDMTTVTTKQTNRETDFQAWCVYHYTDGSYSKKYLGEFKIFANMPEQFGFIANGCENTLAD